MKRVAQTIRKTGLSRNAPPCASETHPVRRIGARSPRIATTALLALAVSCSQDAPVPSPAPPKVQTFDTFVTELADLEALTTMPDPPYVAAQASSRDPLSVTPANAEAWFANLDAGHFLRVEDRDGRSESVMLDVSGPGVVTRIWSANPSGLVRIYVDAETPSMAIPMKELLDGTTVPSPLAGEYGRGFQSYLPIPFGRSCKITVESPVSKGLYWQVGYRRYPAETKIEPFNVQKLSSASLRAAVGRLSAKPPAPTWTLTEDVGSSGGRARYDAPFFGGEVTALAIESNDFGALERARLRIRFDGQQTVDAPMMDFFGGRSGEFASLALSHEGPRASMHFRMPFEKSVEIEVVGENLPPVRLLAAIAPRPWNTNRLYFHATATHRDRIASRPFQDVTLLDTLGEGRIAGLSFRVDARSELWWGEGDEHIRVDDEEVPSFFGTGTEDHFGYGFCSRKLFATPYNAVTEVQSPDTPGFAASCSTGNHGRAFMHRAFVFDSIPFSKRVLYDLEAWHQDPNTTMDVGTVVYWYGRAQRAPK
jgi:hypothetical protein